MSEAFDTCAVIDIDQEEEVMEPEEWTVVLLNDDFTSMEFVVAVIMAIFNHPRPEAERIMLDVHKKGRGVVGTFTKDIAFTKVGQVHSAARENNFPLRCIAEKAP